MLCDPPKGKSIRESEQGMIRSAASKVMWVGRATVFLVGLAMILALIFGVVSRATAHTGSAGLFHLDHNNAVSALSTLTGTLTGAVLKVDNNGTGPTLSLEANAGKPPLTVNSTAGKATNLNADKLDGKESGAFVASQIYKVTKKDTGGGDAFLQCGAGDLMLSGGYSVEGVGYDYDIVTDTVLDNVYYLTWDDHTEFTDPHTANLYATCADQNGNGAG